MVKDGHELKRGDIVVFVGRVNDDNGGIVESRFSGREHGHHGLKAAQTEKMLKGIRICDDSDDDGKDTVSVTVRRKTKSIVV